MYILLKILECVKVAWLWINRNAIKEPKLKIAYTGMIILLIICTIKKRETFFDIAVVLCITLIIIFAFFFYTKQSPKKNKN